jgi:hypothetical protein
MLSLSRDSSASSSASSTDYYYKFFDFLEQDSLIKLKYSFEPDDNLVAIKSGLLMFSFTNVINLVKFSSTVTARTLATVFSYSFFEIMNSLS